MKGLKIINLDDSHAEMYMYGPIVTDDWKIPESMGGEGCNDGYNFPSDIREQLKQMDGKTVDVYINSPGGHVNAGMAIANILARHNGKTIAHNDGEVASIAVAPFMACDERKMSVNTTMMVHPPSTFVAGNASDFEKAIRALNTIQESIINMLAQSAREDISVDDIRRDVEAEKWYTAEEAAKMYDIEIVPARMQAVAYAGDPYGLFKNMPDFVKNGRKLAENSLDFLIHDAENARKMEEKRRKLAIFKAYNNII